MVKIGDMTKFLLSVAREKGDTGNPENWTRLQIRSSLESVLRRTRK
jgi:hypothetical protein